MAVLLCAAGAQAPAAAALDFEVKAGPGIATLSSGSLPTATARDGLWAAVAMRHPLPRRFAVQLEAGYVQRGAVLGSEAFFAPGIPGVSERDVLELGYLEVPVLLCWSPRVKGATAVRLLAGVAVAAKTSEWLHQKGAVEVKTRLDNFTDHDALAVLGMVVETELGRQRWLFEGRFDLGLTNIYQPAYSNDSAHGNDVRIGVGWVWPSRH